jgi:hypothetical protein
MPEEENSQEVNQSIVFDENPATTSQEDAKEPEESAGVEAPAQPSSVPMNRFNAVYREKKELERKLQAMERPAQETVQAQEKPSEPKWEDYESKGKSVEEFNSDWVDHRVNQGLQAANEKSKQEQEQNSAYERQTKAGLNFQAKAQVARSQFEDFDKTLASADAVGISFPPEINLLIAENEKAGELAYHLAKNHDDAYRIMSLPKDQAIYQLGMISSTLQSGNGQPSKMTNSKPPISPLNGGGTVKSEYSDDMTQDEFNTAFPPIW